MTDKSFPEYRVEIAQKEKALAERRFLKHSVSSVPSVFKILSVVAIIILFLSLVSQKELSVLSFLEFLSNFKSNDFVKPFRDFLNNFLFQIPVLGSVFAFFDFIGSGLSYSLHFISSFIFFLF